MYMSEFNQIVNENFDLSDNYTRRFIASLNESGQEQLIAALSSALYEKIIAKVDEIDFGSIPQSRGDITKVQGFVNTEQCIDIIRKLVIQYNQKTDIVDTIITAISNIKDRKNLFTKAFSIKADMPIMIYNLIVLAIERSVSLIIATCIQYVKDPDSSNVKTALDKVAYEKTMDDMLFKQLETFNTLCKNGTMDKTINSSMKPNHVNEEFDIVGSVLGREYNGELGDGETNDINPFGPDSSEEEPIVDNDNEDSDSNFDVYNSNNKPEIDEFEIPSNPIHEPDKDKPEPNPAPIIAKSVRLMFCKPIDNTPAEPEEGCCGSSNDGVEPENIPAVTNDTDDDPSVMDEPITEKGCKGSSLKEASGDKSVSTTGDVIMKGLSSVFNKDNLNKLKENLKKNKKVFATVGIIAGIVALPIAIVKIIIPFIRTVVYYFYYTNMKLTDYLQIQAELIEANANEVENSTDSNLTDEKRTKVIEKQRKCADRLRKWANMFDIDRKQAENKAKKEAEKDSKEKKTVSKDEDGDDSIF